MWMMICGKYLRTRKRLSLIRKHLTLYRKSEAVLPDGQMAWDRFIRLQVLLTVLIVVASYTVIVSIMGKQKENSVAVITRKRNVNPVIESIQTTL